MRPVMRKQIQKQIDQIRAKPIPGIWKLTVMTRAADTKK